LLCLISIRSNCPLRVTLLFNNSTLETIYLLAFGIFLFNLFLFYLIFTLAISLLHFNLLFILLFWQNGWFSFFISLHPCPFLRVFKFKIFHLFIILLSPLISQYFVRIFLFVWHLLPHYGSYFSNLGTSPNSIVYWYLSFFLIVKEKETWWRTFRLMVTLETLSWAS